MIPFGWRFDSRGFTLINMMVGLGIGGIVMLGLAAAVSMTFTAKKNIDLKTDSATYVDELARIVAGTGSCARAFDTATGSTALPLTATPITMKDVTGRSMGAGSLVAQNLEIEELMIRENTAVPAVPAAGGLGNMRRSAILSVKLKSLADPNIPSRKREIPFRVVTTPGGQIVSCSVENSEVQVCETMGGKWDPTALDAQKCRPKGHCLYGGSFSSAPQGGYANPVTGAASCQPGFTQQQTGSIANTVALSKENFQTSYYPVYTCMRCENDIPPAAVPVATTTADFSAALAEALAAGSIADASLFQGFNFFLPFF